MNSTTLGMLHVPRDDLQQFIVDIFERVGVTHGDAHTVASALIAADLEGVSSHGVGLVPLYVRRIQARSVSPTARPVIVEDHGALLTLSAQHGLGQVSSQTAVDLCGERARLHGCCVVAVRDAFHFGAAAYWATGFAARGMIGFALSNTRPLMPAPGGAQRVVGNNPLAIAFPARDAEPLVVDMAASASAMGRIRLAAKRGAPIPEGWATDAQGRPTVNAEEAIGGMLLPAAGPKGFGIAVAVEMLCAGLSGGAVAEAVRPLYDQLDEPYDCSHAFMAIDAQRLGGGAGIAATAARFATSIRTSRRAPGTERIYAPGDLERARRAAAGDGCPLTAEVHAELVQLGAQLGVHAAALESSSNQH